MQTTLDCPLSFLCNLWDSIISPGLDTLELGWRVVCAWSVDTTWLGAVACALF